MYPNLCDQAAVIFYEACKLHAFTDGNKRMAVALVAVYVLAHRHRLSAGRAEFVALAEEVATSDAASRSEVTAEVSVWMGQRMRQL